MPGSATAFISQRNATIRMFSETGGELSAGPIVVPTSTTAENLQTLCNQLLCTSDDPLPIYFRTLDGTQILNSLAESLSDNEIQSEKPIHIIYLPQAIFRVQPVTRCTSSLPGHSDSVVSVAFSPTGSDLASGSGDKTVRLWDLQTELPKMTLEGHKHWVLCVAWSPSGRFLASACKAGLIIVWNAENGKQVGKTLCGHKQWINSLCWKPLHLDPESRFLASGGRDSTIRIWDTTLSSTILTLTGHTASVSYIRWGGSGLIYSASHDRTVKVWRSSDGVLCRTLEGHAHWVNTLALSVDYVLRTGSYSVQSGEISPTDMDKQKSVAKKRYDAALMGRTERLVSGSDDFTMFLWEPEEKKQPIERMTGHQQLINHVLFSPDTRTIASASFDKSIKLWDGNTGKYINSLRGHVQAVYQISWSADSRLLVSASADSTLKVWDTRKNSLMLDLPGHGSDVFAVDWSPDGVRVASGGKDKVLKLWRR